MKQCNHPAGIKTASGGISPRTGCYELKLVTFLNLELILSVLFAIVTLVGPAGFIRAAIQIIIIVFMTLAYAYYLREKKSISKNISKEYPD